MLLPIAGALLALFLPKEKEQDAKWIALAFSGAAFAVSVVVFLMFNPNVEGYQFVDTFTWIDSGTAVSAESAARCAACAVS